ncbi:dihydrofolate reductase family protein [Aeromicrobium chenweiae]|uniref:Deaminase n=1 Tax=Aeromicrobium chenweiae TaxID=2079793 RepID=A0A2S0WRD0_9ACTN|nr:dihydrofolate reductase family protein [Aeromicrobium chenweiae]AWB93794.1 deaminase [Aeromicrobium chenweiae]TGN30839.1 deaminase [Aeromicrobium chenweiae]
MARLLYSTNVSLDGRISDGQGRFDWSEPSTELHQYYNDLFRPVGTHVYGRRLYDSMVVWETLDDEDAVLRDFAGIWRSADKVVHSRTLERPGSARTRIEPDFDPAAVRALVDAADRDVLIGGAELAGQALASGIVDDLHTFVYPVVVGDGPRYLPDGVRMDLELVGQRRFGNGVVHLQHRVLR